MVIYPAGCGDGALKYLMKQYAGLTTKQVAELKRAKSRWVLINKQSPIYMLTKDELKFL
jgi:hypothetical protein